MSQPAKPVVPLIDHAYWFDYSKKMIDGAQNKREAAAASIQKLVVWLWGIYTASAAIGFTLSGKELSFWPAILIAAASGALIIVYWGTVWVQVPITIAFDPRSPTEIESAYSKAVKTKSFRLSMTLFGSVIAAIMVSLALMVASVVKPVKQDYSNIITDVEEYNGRQILSVTAWVGETDKVVVTATPLLPDNKKGESAQAYILPSKEGLVQTSMPIPANSYKTILLELQWTSKSGTEIKISKGIK
jgi:hypothetical protein